MINTLPSLAPVDPDAVLVAASRAELARHALVWEVRDEMPISQWACENRIIGGSTSSRHGYYSLEMFPFQREPQDILTDPDETSGVVVLLWAAQMGKSEMLNNIIGYHIDWRPSPILVMYPTLPQAESWSREKLAPMLRDSPRLSQLIPSSQWRDVGNTLLYKEFPGGWIGAIGSNVPTGLSQHSARVVIADEIDRMATEIPGEGDPLRLLLHRTDAFRDSVRVLASTPTESGSSRIQEWFDRSDQRHWYIPCPHCGHLQTLDWPHVKIDMEDISRSHIVCERCNAPWTEQQRIDSVLSEVAHWRPLAKGLDGTRGYYLNQLCSTMPPSGREYATRIHQIVAEFLQSKKDGSGALRVFSNTVMARTYQTTAEKIDTDPLVARGEQYDADVPDGVLVLVAGVDVQVDRIEYEVVGYGLEDESWGIEHGIVWGNPTRPEIWQEFGRGIGKRYSRADGSSLVVGCWAIDSAWSGEQVMRFCARKDHDTNVVAVRGVGTPGAPVISIPRRRKHRTISRVSYVGTDAAKWTVYGRLRIEQPGPGYCHYPIGRGYDESYFRQLVAERVKERYINGRRVKKFICPANARNEALDLRVYALAALHMLSPDMKALAERRGETVKPAAPPVGRVDAEVNAMLTRGDPLRNIVPTKRRGWVTRW